MKQGDIYWSDDEVVGGRRPVVILSRNAIVDRLNSVIVGPITRSTRRLQTEVDVGPEHGLDFPSIISLDNIAKLDRGRLGRYVGELDVETMNAVYEAIHVVFEMPF